MIIFDCCSFKVLNALNVSFNRKKTSLLGTDLYFGMLLYMYLSLNPFVGYLLIMNSKVHKIVKWFVVFSRAQCESNLFDLINFCVHINVIWEQRL